MNGSSEPKVTRYGLIYAPRDKVIQQVNNYDKELFNGNIGVVFSINIEEILLQINFDESIVDYEFNELDEISLAYAISIHKAQGSEYPAVIMPLVIQYYMLLERNLFYTGVTRGKQLVILIAKTKALTMELNNQHSQCRVTNLISRLSSNDSKREQ